MDRDERAAAPAEGRGAWTRAGGEDELGAWATAEVSGVELKFRYCPPGQFVMGSPGWELGPFERLEPQREVTLTRGFWLGEVPVTQRLWTAVMGQNPSEFKGEERPVERVSWEDCAAFLAKADAAAPGLALRLPTEAEWEYACRAGTTGATYRGPNVDVYLDPIAWYAGNCGWGTRPVRGKAPNRWGLYDMLGNVFEWCSDWGAWGHQGGRVQDPRGPATGVDRVRRGGSFGCTAPSVRAGLRAASAPSCRLGVIGFRLARDG